MQYSFDKVVDREHTCSAKYDERSLHFGDFPVIPLWIADMDFRTAQPVIDALERKAQEGIFGYTSRPAAYFEAVQGWQKRRHCWEFDTALASWSLGVVPAITSMIELFSKPGGEVLIQTPVYNEFYDMVEGCGRRTLDNPLREIADGEWEIDFEDLDRKLEQVELMLLCNPQNPIGRVFPPEKLNQIVQLCAKHHVRLISDEIHGDLIFHGKHHTPTASTSPLAAESVITCISGTKTFNLAGLQACTVVFPDRETKSLFDAYWSRLDIRRNNSFSVVAMTAAFSEGDEWLDQLLTYIDGNFRFLEDYCRRYIPKIKPNLPDATYLVWLNCRELNLDNDALERFMIEKAGLGLGRGDHYRRGLNGFMRLNAACPRSTLERAMAQLRSAIDAL